MDVPLAKCVPPDAAIELPPRTLTPEGSRERPAASATPAGGAAIRWSMEWRDLTFSVGQKQILRGVTGTLEAGRMTAVLGASGSGKSTLLNLLAGRQRTTGPGGAAPLGGTVSVAGTVVDATHVRSHIAYVMQEDRLLATETPRECIAFSAYMTRASSAAELECRVRDMLKMLGLTGCADTVVGSQLLKGISGGERKRTAVGVELITDAQVLFLDEPLSGLDSYAAYALARALKGLAESGMPVLCSVHQPSSEIFAMFDDVVVLHEGETVFHGPNEQVVPYFARWEKCPDDFNPADHIMFMLQRSEKQNSDILRDVKASWPSSELFQAMVGRVDSLRAKPTASLRDLDQALAMSRQVGMCKQLAVLIAREYRACTRNKGILIARFGMSLFLVMLYSWLFAGSARDGDDPAIEENCAYSSFDPSGCSTFFQAHYGTTLSLLCGTMSVAAQPIQLVFPSERPVFLREYAAKQYGVVPYFVSKTLVELPVVFIGQVLTYLCSYWIMGLHGDMLLLIVISWALGVASSSLALLVGCGLASAQKVVQLAPLALIPQMLFSGLFIPVSRIPTSLQWVKHLCPLRYAVNLSAVVEFSFVKARTDSCESEYPLAYCRVQHPGDYLRLALLEGHSVYFNAWVWDALVLVGLFILFRTVACFLLWRRARFVF